MSDPLLTLSQWFSPGFPVGAFAYSHGLEWTIETKQVCDPASLEDWLRDLLENGSGQSDAILLAHAYDADHPTEVDQVARSFCASSERLMETCNQGAAFARTVNPIWDMNLPDLCYPVAVGFAAKQASLPLDLTARFYVQAFAANLISAAVRLVPLGQTDGQRLLASLDPLVSHVAKTACSAELDAISSQCFAADIASMRHETQYSKVFRS